MASIRNLKKDIDLIMSLTLSDCFYVLEYNAKIDEQAIYKLAGDIVQKHREFRLRAIHPDAKDNPKMVKQYYKALVKDMLTAADTALESLSAEVKKTVN
jgi:hypothetical protein